MTVEERLLFIRAGYSAQDISNFEKADDFVKQKPEHPPEQKPEQPPERKPEQKPEQPPEQKPEQPPEQKPEQPEKAPANDSEPAWAKALAESIKTLTAATQAANRRFDDMGEPEQAVDKALDALKEIYGGKTK